MPRLIPSLLIAGSFLSLSSARATETGVGAFGTGTQELHIPASAFVPATDAYTYTRHFGEYINPSDAGTQIWTAPLGLPSGALLDEIRLLVQDDDAGLDISGRLIFWVQAVSGTGACDGSYFYAAWKSDSVGLDGRGILTIADSEPLLIAGRSLLPCGYETYYQLAIEVDLASTTHRFMGAVVVWHRSVSDAPAAATFNDVPLAHPFFQFVEALSAAGITAGCGGGNFCPDAPLTRGQMAVFLAKALGLHWPL